ncbi:MAG: sensor histidine kinase [Desulfuromonas sp.]|nr:response regulator [Desulfuromonas thiophila]
METQQREKILVVDDEPVIVDLCQMLLSGRGYPVATARDGREALSMVERFDPAVVLLDYMMPQMDGMAVLKAIRRDFPDVRVMMFTGKGSEQVAVEVMKAGASDYLLKPFTAQDLVDRIDKVLRVRRIELANQRLEAEQQRLQQEVQAWNLELERRVAEKTLALEKAHQERIQAEKLATVGHLAAGLAHEVRNPLNAISLFAQLLAGMVKPGSEAQGYTDKILCEVDRIDALVLQLLNASRQPAGLRGPLLLQQAINEALQRFSEQLRCQGIDLRCDLQADALPMQGDFAEVVQIFTNLIANALQVLPEGGQLAIRLRQLDALLRVEVTDNGPGIACDNQTRIFDPFFTTRAKGAGMGLSVVLRIVKSCQGRIRVESAPGEGTCFVLEFPLAPADAAEVAQ